MLLMCILHVFITMSYWFDHSGINGGLAVGLPFGLLALILLIGIPLCIFIAVYRLSRRKKRAVQTRVMATNPSAETTTVVSSNQSGTTTAAPVPYPQEPEYKETQFSSQDAPPSYNDTIALPQPVQVTAYTIIRSTVYPSLNLKLFCAF